MECERVPKARLDWRWSSHGAHQGVRRFRGGPLRIAGSSPTSLVVRGCKVTADALRGWFLEPRDRRGNLRLPIVPHGRGRWRGQGVGPRHARAGNRRRGGPTKPSAGCRAGTIPMRPGPPNLSLRANPDDLKAAGLSGFLPLPRSKPRKGRLGMRPWERERLALVENGIRKGCPGSSSRARAFADFSMQGFRQRVGFGIAQRWPRRRPVASAYEWPPARECQGKRKENPSRRSSRLLVGRWL